MNILADILVIHVHYSNSSVAVLVNEAKAHNYFKFKYNLYYASLCVICI